MMRKMPKKKDGIDTDVHENLKDITPRAAALALLRFPDYLELLREYGLDITDNLQESLEKELRAICSQDSPASKERKK